MNTMSRFDFGKNWKSFSDFALSSERAERARPDFHDLPKGVPLSGKTFLDIGFGQGLALCLAREGGASGSGIDIDTECPEALAKTLRFFPAIDPGLIRVLTASIPEELIRKHLRRFPDVDAAGGFDVVYLWGVLRHTGALDDAIEQAASLVRGGGGIW
jgi:2-polyprenyl-6-hydroxyphenyl methylase/3-demethylubiquinone-9 3-methyltransferase